MRYLHQFLRFFVSFLVVYSFAPDFCGFISWSRYDTWFQYRKPVRYTLFRIKHFCKEHIATFYYIIMSWRL